MSVSYFAVPHITVLPRGIETRNRNMVTLTLELPEDVFSALRRSPEEFAKELRFAAAAYWYSRGEISQEKAADIAGMERADFLLTLAREGLEVFQVNFQDLKKELARG
jgi:predicted HTH domain antitoxin